jgi:hypothetical protein
MPTLAVFIISPLESPHMKNSLPKYMALKYEIYIRQCTVW